MYNKNTQPQQVVNNQLAIPVGTNLVISYDKFLWKQRDLNCLACKNGMKSQVTKRINEKTYLVPVVCTCVPYIQSEDTDGVQVVVYKGRRERWVNGKRPEIYISDEKVRSAANTAAVNTKQAFEGDNVINGKKFQFVKNRAEINPKYNPNVPLPHGYKSQTSRPMEIPTEFSTQSNLPANPHYGEVTEKNLEKSVPGAQKHLQTLPNGNRVFVDDSTFRKLGGVPTPVSAPVKVAAGNPGNPVFTTTPAPTGKRRGRPKKDASTVVKVENAEVKSVSVAPVNIEKPATISVAPVTEKKKRGRPKKAVANA